MNTPPSRPRIASGAALCKIAVRKTPHHVRGPRSGQQQQREPEPAGQAEADDATAPGEDRGQHRQALPLHPPEPTAEQRTEQGAGGERAVHRAGSLLAAVEHLVGQRGEQRPRHAEHHRDDVDHEGHEQHLAGEEEAQPFHDAGEPRSAAAALGRHRGQGQHRRDRGGEGHRIQSVRGTEAERADEEAGEQWPTGQADVELDLPQRVPGRQQLLGQQPRHEGRPRRRVEREQAGLGSHDRVQQPDLLGAREGLREQDRGQPGLRRRCGQHQPAPVDGVGHRPAVQAEDDQRHETGETDQADRGRRTGQGIDLQRYGDGGDLRADDAHRVADQQIAVGRGRAQRREVQRDTPPAPSSRCLGRQVRRHGDSLSTRQLEPSRR